MFEASGGAESRPEIMGSRPGPCRAIGASETIGRRKGARRAIEKARAVEGGGDRGEARDRSPPGRRRALGPDRFRRSRFRTMHGPEVAPRPVPRDRSFGNDRAPVEGGGDRDGARDRSSPPGRRALGPHRSQGSRFRRRRRTRDAETHARARGMRLKSAIAKACALERGGGRGGPRRGPGPIAPTRARS